MRYIHGEFVRLTSLLAPRIKWLLTHTTYCLLCLAMSDSWIEIAALAAPVVCDRHTKKTNFNCVTTGPYHFSVCV